MLHRTHWRKYALGTIRVELVWGEGTLVGELSQPQGNRCELGLGITGGIHPFSGTLDSHAWPPNLSLALGLQLLEPHNDEAHHSHPHHQSTSQTAKLSSTSTSMSGAFPGCPSPPARLATAKSQQVQTSV